MKLRQNNRVYFEPESHTYLLDGETVLIGVTSLMKKHDISPDYSNIPEAVLNNAAAEGTAIHNLIEDYDNGVAVPMEPLLKEYRKLGLKFIANEYLVSDNETIASKIDGIYKGQAKNAVILVDYKTTVELHRRSLEWQLGIYKVYFERQNPGLVVEACYCLHIDKKKRKILGLVPIEPVDEIQVDALLEAERNGLPYFDEQQTHDASEMVPAEEIQTYIRSSAQIAELKAKLKEVEDAVKAWEKKLLDHMQSNNIEELQSEGGVFTIKKAYTRMGYDTKLLAAEHPKLAKKYEKPTVVGASLTFKPNK